MFLMSLYTRCCNCDNGNTAASPPAAGGDDDDEEMMTPLARSLTAHIVFYGSAIINAFAATTCTARSSALLSSAAASVNEI